MSTGKLINRLLAFNYQCCEKLGKRMKSSYEKNMKKFSTYADRNIFVASETTQRTEAAVSDQRAKSSKEQLDIITDEVEALKETYLTLRANHIQLTNDCKDGDLLLKDMRKSLFTIRVGAQTLDEFKVQPLIETVAILEQHQQTMTELSSRAKGTYVVKLFKILVHSILLSSFQFNEIIIHDRDPYTFILLIKR